VLVGLVGSPVSWSLADHHAVMVGPLGEREDRDDRRGRPVSENERGRERARCWVARPGVTGPGASERGRA
jgi:hypothetical protein